MAEKNPFSFSLPPPLLAFALGSEGKEVWTKQACRMATLASSHTLWCPRRMQTSQVSWGKHDSREK